MKALVIGGYHSQMRGAWGRALKENLGIEIALACCADDNFRGMPTTLPKGIDVILVVAGTCSHKASERAMSLARGDVRCETVSKDATRTVQWLWARGYRRFEKPEPAPADLQGPVEAPCGPEEVQVEPEGSVDGTSEPVQEAIVQVENQPPPRTPSVTEWVDSHQAASLLPQMPRSTFYKLVRQTIRREPRYESRAGWDGKGRPRQVMVWTLDEVAQMDKAFQHLYGKSLPHSQPQTPVTDSTVTDSTVTDLEVSKDAGVEEQVAQVLQGMESLFRTAIARSTEEAEQQVAHYKRRCAELEVERDTLQTKLDKILLALL